MTSYHKFMSVHMSVITAKIFSLLVVNRPLKFTASIDLHGYFEVCH